MAKMVRGVDFAESLDRSSVMRWVLKNTKKLQHNGGPVYFSILPRGKTICLSFDLMNEGYGQPGNEMNPTICGECCHLKLTTSGWEFSKGQLPFKALKDHIPAAKKFSETDALVFVKKFFEIAEEQGLNYADVKKAWVAAGRGY